MYVASTNKITFYMQLIHDLRRSYKYFVTCRTCGATVVRTTCVVRLASRVCIHVAVQTGARFKRFLPLYDRVSSIARVHSGAHRCMRIAASSRSAVPTALRARAGG
eukprot:8700508-Alexandrium_andersonii.AAC.1